MEWWNNIDFKSSLITNKKEKYNDKKYISLIAAFDIETSTVEIDDENKIAFMYVWQMAIENVIFYGRTWEDFRRCLEKIQNELSLNSKFKMVVYVHSMKFDFSFFKSECNVSSQDFLARDSHDVIKCIVNDCFEFRDSYCYTEKPLEDMGREIGISKMDGEEYDYKKIRHSETPLTPYELQYCENDVKILVKYFRRECERYGSIADVPLTLTQRVKKVLWKHYREIGSRAAATARKLKDTRRDKATLRLLRSAYWGAINFCNPLYIGYPIDDVVSVDLDSAYGALALSKKFPNYKFQSMPIPKDPIDLINDKYSYLITLKIVGLKNKYPNIGFLPSYKIRHWDYNTIDAVIDQGKILSTSSAIITITEIDFKLLYEFYTWTKLKIINVLGSKKTYLPDYITQSIIELYQDKKRTKKELQEIRKARKTTDYEELNYSNVKSMVSRIYGVFVQDPEPDIYKYDSELNTIESDRKNKISSASDLTSYQWGVWITAYCRYEMLMLLKKIAVEVTHGKERYKNIVLYIDTDCVKFINDNSSVANIITQYNKNVKKIFKEFCQLYEIPYKTIEGIGELDREDYKKVKLLGQKKYVYINNKDEFVYKISGLSKKNKLFDNKTPEECMDIVKLDMEVPADIAKNSECKYVTYDKHRTFLITDYLGESLEVSVKSFAVINKVPYTSNSSMADMLKHINPEKVKRAVERR